MNVYKIIEYLIFILSLLLLLLPFFIFNDISATNRDLESYHSLLSYKSSKFKNKINSSILNNLSDTVITYFYTTFKFNNLQGFYKKEYIIEINVNFDQLSHDSELINNYKINILKIIESDYLKIYKLNFASLILRFDITLKRQFLYYEFQYNYNPDINEFVLIKESNII